MRQNHFIHFIQKWIGNKGYIISFSQTNNDPVMWGHYTNNHRGFCLCFTMKDNYLKAISTNTFLQKEYQVEKVIYDTSSKTVDASYNFPYMEKEITENERIEHHQNLKEAYLTKYVSWEYENEVRLLHIDKWATPKDGKIQKAPSNQRIFYYDPNQLTGIIFGAKMSKLEKDDIISQLYSRRLQDENGLFSIFIVYQAKENSSNFKMDIDPLFGLDHQNRHFKIEELDAKIKEYESLLEWYKNKEKNPV